GVERRREARDPARDGDVRARRRHVADERLDLGGGARPRHDRERRAVGDRVRGARLAAVILIGRKVARLIGRQPAGVLGLRGYAAGALSVTLSQSLVPIIIFWAVIGGLGASLLLPSMESLIHGNFQGAMQRRAYALVGASAAIAAAIGPLVGGFITTYLSWR